MLACWCVGWGRGVGTGGYPASLPACWRTHGAYPCPWVGDEWWEGAVRRPEMAAREGWAGLATALLLPKGDVSCWRWVRPPSPGGTGAALPLKRGVAGGTGGSAWPRTARSSCLSRLLRRSRWRVSPAPCVSGTAPTARSPPASGCCFPRRAGGRRVGTASLGGGGQPRAAAARLPRLVVRGRAAVAAPDSTAGEPAGARYGGGQSRRGRGERGAQLS